jgi:hypothetical protein
MLRRLARCLAAWMQCDIVTFVADGTTDGTLLVQ